MSINMANVKSITLGGVSVKRIEDTNGRILWSKTTQTATIELTVGAGQDITTTQSRTQLNLPSIDTIKNAIHTKTGRIASNITKVEIYTAQPLYWLPPSDTEIEPWLASNSSGTKPTSPYISGTSRTITAVCPFGSASYTDITTLINQTKTKPFYGWVVYVRVSSNNCFRMDDRYRGKLCDSNGNSPVYKIRVTYEY